MQNSAMHGDLLGVKSPINSTSSFIFEGPDVDGVGMDGILSDSNDSSSSSTENGLNSFINSTATLNHANGQMNHHQLEQPAVFHQLTPASVHQQVNNGNNHSNTNANINSNNGTAVYHQQQSNMSTHMMPEKRKHDDNGQQQGHEAPVKKTPPPNGKKTKGRVKIKMEFIDNKLRRYTTFSKRKTGIMKKVSCALSVAKARSSRGPPLPLNSLWLISCVNRHMNYRR